MGISAQQQRRAKAKAISKAAAKLLAEIDPLILHLIEPLPLAPPRELGVSPELLPLGTKLGELAPKAELDSFRTLLRGIEREFTRVGAAAATEKLRLWCARDAAEMIRRFSEKPPTSGNAKSPFRAVTSLLFEAATGRPRIDLERACEAVLAEAVLAHGARTPASAIFPVTTRHRPKRRASMAARISRRRD